MRVRSWTDKALWFVFGAVAFGLLVFISTAYSKPTQDILQRLDGLERRIYVLERDKQQREAAAAAAAKEGQKEAQRENRRLWHDPE
ncbi:MAG: hypothetical protein QOJ02_2113 [Acidobacteriota bacterium]|jgi:hypothetical protein|nr:hypothetical protein [Acidobacteriota bacterium]